MFFFSLDVRRNENRIEYLMQQEDHVPPIILSSAEGFERFPDKVLNFLERQIQFDRGLRDETAVTETPNVQGLPIRITCKYLFKKFFRQ